MENIKANRYASPELEIIRLECNDIITTSGNDYVADDNEDDSW